MDKENRPQMISPDFLLSIKTAKFIRESNKDKHYDIENRKKKISPKAVKHCLGNSEMGDLFNICVITIVLVILLTQSSIMTLNVKTTI